MEKERYSTLKKIFKKKRTYIIIVIVLLIGSYLIFKPSSNVANTVTDSVKYADLKQTILATGQVVSSTDLNLSFNGNGVVSSIKVKVGDKVPAGTVLATLDQSSVLATLTSAKGSLAAANARYKRTQEGASNEEVALSQVTFDQTKLTQETLVKNAYQNLLNSSPEAYPKEGTNNFTAPIISGTYSKSKEGKINLEFYNSSGGTSFSASGLTDGIGLINSITPQPIGDSGLYIKFPTNEPMSVNEWIIEIPNKKAANYLMNLNAYQAVVAQAKSAIDQSAAQLALKKSTARQSDLDLAMADIISAQGQVQQATAQYNNTMIKAPLSGTITSIDIKPGELAAALKPVITLQDVSNIYLEANVNEANIANLEIGLPIDISYDAFGSERLFKGNITKIDPSSTLVSGVVNYKITASVEQVANLRPGMTANMTIKAKEKDHILVIPSRAILTDTAGNKTVRVITNTKNKKYKEVPITTGMEGDGGMIEITSGLSDGEEIVVLIKK